MASAAGMRLLASTGCRSGGAGYFKEIGWDGPGRFVCNAHGDAVQLLALERHPTTHWKAAAVVPTGQRSPVLCCQMSPTMPLLATGSMNGAVTLCQPKW